MAASRCVRCMQCLCCGFVLGRRGHFSRRSSIQGDEISCIRDHLKQFIIRVSTLFNKILEIKGQTREVHRLTLNSKFLVHEKSREQVKRAGTNGGLDCYIMPRLRIWRFVSSQCKQ